MGLGPSERGIRVVDARLLGKGRGEPEEEKLREGKGEHALDLAILPAAFFVCGGLVDRMFRVFSRSRQLI